MNKIFFLIIFNLLSLFPYFVYAAETPDFNKIGAAICDQINKGKEAYQSNDTNNAHIFVLMAYFKGYDANIEPALRKIARTSHIFAVEQQFRDLSNNMTPNPTVEKKQEINTLAETLCKTVMADAQSLISQH